MSRGERPHFRFHPRAYEDGAFVESEDVCAACARPCVWKYAGGVYCLPPEPIVCAWCIADGNLARVVDEYGLHDFSFDSDDVGEELVEEVNGRTPGFSTFNPFVWPVRNGVPLAFIGVGDEKQFNRNEAVHAAERKALANYFGEPEEDAITGSSYTLIFQELDGGAYVATCDFD